MDLEQGLTGDATLVVNEADTAQAFGSGDVAVLATPRVIALCEEATNQALQGRLPDGCTSVGVQVRLDHVMPSGLGAEVVAEAKLEKIAGRKLIFTVAAHEGRCLVAAGRVTRVVVDIQQFLAKTR
ncbi:MAG: thioesterase [Actinomycetia bacterium]|nr:thioesterase [Actinomycetes bacterium]